MEGRTFIALCRDVVIADGGEKRMFEPLWWRAGRFIELLVESGDQPLTVEAFGLLETRYPLEMESRFNSSDARLNAVTPVALRGLQMCAHETYMDCPYYEQMMYVGDSRLEALTTYAISADDRLPRKVDPPVWTLAPAGWADPGALSRSRCADHPTVCAVVDRDGL